MLGLKAKVLLALGIALALILSLWWGISQYGTKQVLEAKLQTTEETVQIAVETRKEDLKVDVQTRKKRRVLIDSVRSSGIPVEKTIEETPVAAGCADPVFDGLLNDAIRSANTAISAARGVSE